MSNHQPQPIRTGPALGRLAPAECRACAAASPLVASTQVAMPPSPAFSNGAHTGRIDADVSVGPLLTGITMMILMRRHRG